MALKFQWTFRRDTRYTYFKACFPSFFSTFFFFVFNCFWNMNFYGAYLLHLVKRERITFINMLIHKMNFIFVLVYRNQYYFDGQKYLFGAVETRNWFKDLNWLIEMHYKFIIVYVQRSVTEPDKLIGL